MVTGPFSPANVKKMLPVLQAKSRELCRVLERDTASSIDMTVDGELVMHCQVYVSGRADQR